MKRMSTRMLVEAGIMIALATVLSLVKVFEAPYGGSVTAGSMVPIILFSLRWGVKPGLLVGAVYGLLQLIIGPTYFAGISVYSIIASVLLDYVVAFSFLGLAGLARKSLKGVFFGVFLSISGRFISHVISGKIIWSSFAPEDMNAWLYSILYNGAYLLPELIIAVVIVAFIYKPLNKYILV